MRPHRPGHVEGSAEVDRQDSIPAFVGLVGEVAPVASARVVEQDVDASVGVDHGLYGRVDLLAVGHVAAYEQGIAAFVLHGLLDGVTLGLAPGDDGDFSALLGKQVDGPLSDSAVSSGDYCYLVG